MDQVTKAVLLAVVMTAGEFGFALYLLFMHGDWFAAYLAITYYIREHAPHYDDITLHWMRAKITHSKG